MKKWWKEKTSNQYYCTQQGSQSDLKEKSKTLQTSKSWENSATLNQPNNKYWRNFSRQEGKDQQLETKIPQMTRLTSKGIYTVKIQNHPGTIMPPKSEIVRRGGYKCRTLEMHLQLRDQQLKIYIESLLYQNFRVTANWKSTIDTQTNKKNQLKYNTKGSHQTRRGENKRRREEKTATKTNTKQLKMAIRTYISIITLNVNGLNATTKRHWLAEWIQKQDPYICCLQETHFTSRDTYKLKVRGWKKIFHANGFKRKLE